MLPRPTAARCGRSPRQDAVTASVRVPELQPLVAEAREALGRLTREPR